MHRPIYMGIAILPILADPTPLVYSTSHTIGIAILSIAYAGHSPCSPRLYMP